MQISWSQFVFIVVNVVSLPLYILIIVIHAKMWKSNRSQRTYYLLLISQGVVDIIVMMSYFCFGTLRLSQLLSNFYWSYQHYYVARWCFSQIYVSIFIRCFGVLLISFQRYVSICRSGSRIEQIINFSNRWILLVLLLVIPSVYSVPLIILGRATFREPENLELVAEKKDITLATSMAVIFVSITFILCSFCYGAILRFLINNRYSNNAAIKRERRLYVQMLGLFIAFGFFFAFSVMQFIFSLHFNDGPIYTMRVIFPVISCFFSYVHVWMMLLLNKEIRTKIFLVIRCQSNKIKDVSFVHSTNATSTMNVLPTFDTRRI